MRKKRKNFWIYFLAIGTFMFFNVSCSDEEPDPQQTLSFHDKSELFSSTGEDFRAYKESTSFSEAVTSILNDLNNNEKIVKTGLSNDTLGIWWEAVDNTLFSLQVRILDNYVDSLDEDNLKKEKHNEFYFKNALLPHNNKALLLSPSYYDWAYVVPGSSSERKDINYYFKNKLESKGFDVSYYRKESPESQDITLEHYFNWDEYGIISFSGHGSVVNGNLFGITSGIEITEELENQYFEKFINQEFMYAGDGKNQTIGLTNLFFENNYNYLENTFILMSACVSQYNSILALDLIEIGGNSVYWGWTENMQPLAGAWRNTRYMIDQLLYNGKTCGETYNLMVDNNRHRHLLVDLWWLPSSYYTYLEMTPHSNTNFQIVEHDTPSNCIVNGPDGYTYTLTSNSYDVLEDDLDQAVINEFGASAVIADWNDLKTNFSDDISLFLDGICVYSDSDLGVTSATVLRDGNSFHSGDRHYLMRRFDGDVSGGWAVHDHIDNYTLCLGSWWGTRRILVKYPTNK